jgi:Fic family protein
MDISRYSEKSAGRIVQTPQGYHAFVPNSLPPDLTYSKKLVGELSGADRALSLLEGVGRRIPNPLLLVNPYMRREAVLSSRIEGTQASMSDLFLFEAEPDQPPKLPDVREVHNYVRALTHGLKRLHQLPLSQRLTRELHRTLVQDVRGEHGSPGEFRNKQNWVGPPGCTLDTAVFVPPPPVEMHRALGEWEKFLHIRDASLPPLLQCALMHYQFEAIHPFVDGNGRVGRLLIVLFLIERGLLTQPLLYLSAYFERNRDEYYYRLQAVDQRADWENWLIFFLKGIAQQSQDGVSTAELLLGLHLKYKDKLQKRRVTGPTLALLDQIFINPYISIPRATTKLGVSYPTAQASVRRLVAEGILEEVTRRYRNRIYCARELLRIAEGGGLGNVASQAHKP